MENKHHDELDALIRASLQISDTPSLELNQRLKANLYQQEAATKQRAATRRIAVWYVPMIFNFVLFSLFAVVSLLAIGNPYIAKLVACICAYAALAGIAITAIGATRTQLKENLVIHFEKRGTVA